MKAMFNPFNPHAETTVYRRHLPHWRQDGATYFVTFRLADSIPKQILLRWREERELWRNAHGITDGLSDDEKRKRYLAIPEKQRQHFERAEARRLHLELDRCHGGCLLRQRSNAEILRQAIAHFHGERCWVGDFIVMPNHVHLLVQSFKAHPLEEWLKSLKSFASRRVEKESMPDGRVFQRESYDRIVRNRTELERYRKYIAENGIKAGLPASDYFPHRCDWL